MDNNLLEKILEQINCKESQIAALQEEVGELRRVASVFPMIPRNLLPDLGIVARVVTRLEGGKVSDSVAPPASSTGVNGKRPLPPERDLANKTIVQCAEVILGEHQPHSVHYRDLFQEASVRGYRGRASSTPEQVERSWIQTLRRVALEGGPVERTGEGMFRLREKEKTDAE